MYTEYLEIHIRIHTYIIKQLQVIYMHVSIYTQILEEKNQLLGKTVKKKIKHAFYLIELAAKDYKTFVLYISKQVLMTALQSKDFF